MNLVIKLFVTICSIFIFISNIETAEITPHHCCQNGIIISSRKCQDGSNISLSCDEYTIVLDPSRSSYQQFSIAKDVENDGKAYLDAFISGYHVYQPYFCTGDIQYFYSNRTSSNVAIACSSSRKWYKDVNVTGSESVQTAKIYRIFSILSFIFNFASAILLLLTAAIYYALPNMRDVQGTCYFIFTLISGLGHLTLTYMEVFNTEGILPNMCITNTYLGVYFLLCAMSWSTVTSYHIWRISMNYHCDNEAELLKRYKLFGFGFPFILIFCAWAYVHITHIADLTLNVDCSTHQQLVYGYYVALPVLSLICSNALMFIHSQIRIWNLHSIQSQDRKLTKKILKYRLFMNAKLFFMMGVPWAILMLIYLIENSVVLYDDTIIVIIQFAAALLVLIEGVPIFFILVIFRKRVLRGIGNKWFANSKIYPDKWKTMRDSETEEEVSDSETPPKSLEAKFTAKNDEQDNDILGDSAIVIL